MGHVRFSDLTLATLPGRVMTPRAATGQLGQTAVARIAERPVRVGAVGTGSGAIAVAVAVNAPSADVWATDTSRCSVALARANARRHGLSSRLTVCHGDLLDPVPGPVDLVLA